MYVTESANVTFTYFKASNRVETLYAFQEPITIQYFIHFIVVLARMFLRSSNIHVLIFKYNKGVQTGSTPNTKPGERSLFYRDTILITNY